MREEFHSEIKNIYETIWARQSRCPETDLTEGRGRTHAPTIGNIVAAFKSISTKKYNEKNDVPGFKLWQRNYFEHVIRNDKSYQLISNYIVTNPVNWSSDATE